MDLYNIGWVMAHSEISKKYLESFEEISFLDSYKELSFYKVHRRHTYFVKGSGRVDTKTANRIVLTDLSGPEVVLKYHYIPGLVSSPETDIKPVYISDDPLPFIQLNNPLEDITLSLDH